MSDNIIEKIENEVKEFFARLVTDFQFKISQKENVFNIDLQTKEFQELLGEKGKTLLDIQHLLNAVLKKKIHNEIVIDVDINGYKERKIRYLKELAKAIADEVSLTKKEKILEPMPAYERRIIHLELAARPDVTTESIGKEPNRRIVIKPYP